ncbi:binding-protein-dependent transport systems inner membrane component [Desulfurococcus mucosus DSM 2162]|uniref:Binding-protein-dependent transport systems inner membrane component n=2 Tax=Desulfurococcus mucosus TaxID=2275 RepID=E8R8K2_DESM0|nr:binding-protein-dependent transport systems inner membrane component [Desulfurococcus mucosus DSM 2162]
MIKAGRGRNANPWILVLPAFMLLLLFNIFPLVWSLGLSFYSFSLIIRQKPNFVWVSNYANLITSQETWDRFAKTGVFIGYSLILQFGLALLFSLLLFGEFKGRKVVITALTIPLMIAPVASALIFRYLFDEMFGPVNQFLRSHLGVSPLWFSNELSPIGVPYAMLMVILVETWIWTPFVMFLIMAGISAIPQDLVEQSRVDGLRFRYVFRFVILPYVKPMLAIALIFRFMDSLKTFDTVYVLTAGGPGTTTELISVHIYKLAFERWDFGSATALSYLVLVIVIFATNLFMHYLMGGGER